MTRPTGRRPWFPFYVDDFVGDELVRLHDNRLVGIYVRLLCHQWREGSLPTDERALALIAHETPNQFRKVWAKLKTKFVEREGRLCNPRMLEEQDKAEQRSRIAGSASRASNNAEQRFLYAIAARGFRNYFSNADEQKLIKIGWSRNPSERMRGLNHPDLYIEERELLGQIAASIALERRAHVDLAEHVLTGEWFTDNEAVRAWLQTNGVTNGVTGGSTAGQVPEPATVTGGKPAEQSQSQSQKNTPTPKTRTASRDDWVPQFASAWRARFGGNTPWGRIGKALKDLRAQYPDAEILARWERYLAQAEGKYLSPENFAQKFGEWAPRRDNYLRPQDVA